MYLAQNWLKLITLQQTTSNNKNTLQLLNKIQINSTTKFSLVYLQYFLDQ